MSSPYDILNVKSTDSLDVIKSAYKKLLFEFHPDLHDEKDKDFFNKKTAEIIAAYNFILLNHKDNNSNSSKNNDNKYKSSANNINSSSQKTTWEEYRNSFEQEYRKRQRAYYAQMGINMKSKIAKNLEPIRRLINEFKVKVDISDSYDELKDICEDYLNKTMKMIKDMYDYTEKHHRYGLPKYYNVNQDIKIDSSVFNPNIELIKVESNFIDSVAYDESNKVLYVKFLNNSLYAYYYVDQNIYCNFIKSESKGKFFEANIRNEYNYELVK